jgi:hypothetical protein
MYIYKNTYKYIYKYIYIYIYVNVKRVGGYKDLRSLDGEHKSVKIGTILMVKLV